MAIAAYVYVATAEGDYGKLVRIFGEETSLEVLRSGKHDLTQITSVEQELGEQHADLEWRVRQIPGVARVEMVEERGGADIPMSPDFQIFRHDDGDWKLIMGGIRTILGALLGEDYDICMREYTFRDTPSV